MSEEIVFKDRTLEISEQAKKAGLKVEKDGTVTIPDGLYESTLEGTGLDMATVKKVHAHTTEVIAGFGHAIGHQAQAVMEKQKTVDVVNATIPVHKDKIGYQYDRSRETNDGQGGKVINHGVLSVKYTVSGAGGSKGELKKVRSHLKSLGEKAFAE
mgnify:CR=1 FL=1